jgi:hypothetical protein
MIDFLTDFAQRWIVLKPPDQRGNSLWLNLQIHQLTGRHLPNEFALQCHNGLIAGGANTTQFPRSHDTGTELAIRLLNQDWNGHVILLNIILHLGVTSHNMTRIARGV